MTLLRKKPAALAGGAIPPELAPFWERAADLIAPVTPEDIGREAHAEAVRDIAARDATQDSIAVRGRRVSSIVRADDLSLHYTQTRGADYTERIRARRHLAAARRLASQAESAARARVATDRANRCVVCGELGDVRIYPRRTERTCKPCDQTLTLVEQETEAATVVNGQTRRDHARAYLARV